MIWPRYPARMTDPMVTVVNPPTSILGRRWLMQYSFSLGLSHPAVVPSSVMMKVAGKPKRQVTAMAVARAQEYRGASSEVGGNDDSDESNAEADTAGRQERTSSGVAWER